MYGIYEWMQEWLREEFHQPQLLKESERSNIYLLYHRGNGERFILRHFRGSAEIYHSLLSYTCPNLPKVLEVGSQGDDNLVLEEYIPGDTLDYLLQGALFAPRETRSIIKDVCRALWVLHEMNAVHRDVKPENIILRGAQAVLIDFDAARLVRSEQDSDTCILGTTGFAAPEQYGFSQSDWRADIYSLGVLINVMLTGEHPSRKLAGGQLGRVVERCTQVNPKNRYQNVQRLMEAL